MRNVFGFFFIVLALAALLTVWRELSKQDKQPVKAFLLKHWWIWVGILLAAWAFLVANSQFVMKLF